MSETPAKFYRLAVKWCGTERGLLVPADTRTDEGELVIFSDSTTGRWVYETPASLLIECEAIDPAKPPTENE